MPQPALLDPTLASGLDDIPFNMPRTYCTTLRKTIMKQAM